MKKIVSLTMTMVLSAMTVMAISPYKLEKIAGHHVLKSTGEQAVVLAEFDHNEDITNMPIEVQSLLDTYIGVESDEAAFVQFAQADNDSVGPLLGNIEYDQGTPYNDLCPIINGGRAVTGCVATAMAQIMRYWKHPRVGTGEATYTSSSGAATYVFSQHPFDWDNMLEQYTYSVTGNPKYNATEATAVANLMLACGASVNMNYSSEASGSYIQYSYNALRTYFGYSENMKYYESDSPNWEDWTENLQEQFDKGLPVLYAGTATSGGHAFVLDGYKIEPTSTGGKRTMFHVNWGWSGHYNGWYPLRGLKPDKDNYSNLQQRVVLDIRPVYSQAIEQTEADETVRASKELRNGQVVIVRNNNVYTVQGQRIE